MKNLYFELFSKYVTGWKENDINLIKEPLSAQSIVIESHGPKYFGAGDIEIWFDLWIKAKSKINKWKIISFNSSKEKEAAFFQWDFSCLSSNKNYEFLGSSYVEYKNKKINLIHEYRMTHSIFDWNKKTLISE